jgi:uncharacterized membrane protein
VVTIARKLGLGHAGPLFDSAINNMAALVAATTFVCVSGNRGALVCDRRSMLYCIGGGIMEHTSVFLVLLSLGLGAVSVVTSLAGTPPLFVLLLTCLVPWETTKLHWRIIVGVVLIVLGVVALTGYTHLLSPAP